MRLAAGTDLGPYRIRRLLGAGGMGEVYEGRDARLDRAVAINITGHKGGGSLRIRGLNPGTGRFDAYGDPSIAARLTFDDHLVPGRLTDYAASRSAIVAGAHVLQTTT